MAVAADLDRATDSTWADWIAEQTRTYLASNGTEGLENGVRMLVLVTSGRSTGQPQRLTCSARLATPSEREPLWPQMVRIFPLYEEYSYTDRQVPVVVLTPED